MNGATIKIMNSTIKTAVKNAEEFNQSNENSDTKKEVIQRIKAKLEESLETKWESKGIQGQYIRSMDRQLIGGEDTLLWLSRGDLKGETDSEIIAAQDQALQIKYHATKILQTETDSECRVCQQSDETLEHIVSACPIMAKAQYIKRRDRVCEQLHFTICVQIGVKLDNKHRYDLVPKSVETSHEGKVTILRNQQVRTDRTVPNNKPDP